jgi:hypothetical protein
MFLPLEFTGKYKVKTDKGYLIKPLPGFKRDINYADYFTDIIECGFGFKLSHAQDNVNLLAWDYKINGKIIK